MQARSRLPKRVLAIYHAPVLVGSFESSCEQVTTWPVGQVEPAFVNKDVEPDNSIIAAATTSDSWIIASGRTCHRRKGNDQIAPQPCR